MTGRQDQMREYLLSRARETLQEAEMMLGVAHLNAYVNRLYYACFYGASALLAARGIRSKRHSHVQAALNREFVKTGAVPRELGSHYNRLFESRLESEYGEFVRFERDDVAGWLEPTRAFVSHVERLLGEAPTL